MNSGRKNSKPNIGSHGHAGDTRPGEKRKTPKNLSAHESEERGREESVGLYPVCMRERGGGRRGRSEPRNAISPVIHTQIHQFHRGKHCLSGSRNDIKLFLGY